MFRAIGIGYSRSLPSAAALNWVLKDGLGRFSRCIYTASLASAFDTNLKVWRIHMLLCCGVTLYFLSSLILIVSLFFLIICRELGFQHLFCSPLALALSC